ncbi:LysR family transcriptional regulator [Oleisolibacter albus]|uniref:LysR family transcriptional regulator n=1 Tax=Oleisolibacter albus TaxID=2171757 RepID=UPI000DF490EE|nr:LysR family transcriptional regulator [Oleisolibacter albus]
MKLSEPDWDLYRTFLAVLRGGSLSAAARSLGLTQPTVGRQVEALEASLGAPLFLRSPLGLTPTALAEALRPQAEAMAATAEALLRMASGQGQGVRGTVRLTASEVVGVEVLPPILAGLRVRHPALEIELVLSNAVDDLLRQQADIAVRMVEPRQEALLVRRLGEIPVGLYAHQTYLMRCGVPQQPEDLADHTVIGFDRETPAIRAMRERLPAVAQLRYALRADSDVAQLAAIRAGFGIGFCQVPLARRTPDLVRVLPAYVELRLGTWIVMHSDLRSAPRCRAVFDGLVDGLRSHVER